MHDISPRPAVITGNSSVQSCSRIHDVAFIVNVRSENGEHDIFVAPIVSLPTTYRGDRPMILDTDYVLGIHDEEIARLGIQHQVWRSHMLDAWPGYATCDAAEIVGP